MFETTIALMTRSIYTVSYNALSIDEMMSLVTQNEELLPKKVVNRELTSCF